MFEPNGKMYVLTLSDRENEMVHTPAFVRHRRCMREDKFLAFVDLHADQRQRVFPANLAAHEFADVMASTVIPVRMGAPGLVQGCLIKGKVQRSCASLVVMNADGEQLAVLAVALTSRASATLWDWVHEHSPRPMPPPAWAALRSDVPEHELPDWIEPWAMSVACAFFQVGRTP